jgi:beta-glucanase (GH16 family)
MYLKNYAAALTAVLPIVAAQTYSDCNPTKKSCSPDSGQKEYTFSTDFTKDTSLDGWETAAGNVTFDDNGAAFTINQKGDAPTIDTKGYFFFGRVDVEMKAAPGTGVVSSIVMESDDLDEIDWEGVGGYTDRIETNYFGKGDTTTYDRETWVNLDTPQETFHTYTVDWTKDSMTWLIDGNSVRTVKYAEAKDGSRYPQTPMKLRLGIWAGGDPDNGQGTIEWAGGETDYTQAPFSMYVKSVTVTNYNPADTYEWTDTSGSYQSIKASNGTSSDSSSSSTSGDSSSTSTSGSSTSTATGASASTTSDSSSAATSTSDSTTGAGAGSGSSTSGSGSGSDSASASGSGASASPTPFDGAASAVSNSFVAPTLMLALFAAMFQL